MAIKISKTTISVDGKRNGIRIDTGPWAEGVPAELIKIRCKRGAFSQQIRAAFVVENNSDSREDYFEADSIRLMPGHPLYEAAKALAA